ncbi:MAG: ABC transporter ATP-binding protein [Pirellulales bacterium]
MTRHSTSQLSHVIRSLATGLDLTLDIAVLERDLTERSQVEGISLDDLLMRSGLGSRLSIHRIALAQPELAPILRDGIPTAVRTRDDSTDRWWVFLGNKGSGVEGVVVTGERCEPKVFSAREIQSLWKASPDGKLDVYCAQQALPMQQSMHGLPQHSPHAAHPNQHHASSDHHEISPTSRLIRMLALDWGDIISLIIFGFTAGVLNLASPLAVEWVVTTIGFGRYLQPLIILAILLFTFLAFAGTMRILQVVVVEILQRRMMVRFVSDLAFRLPLIRPESWHGLHPAEQLNRFFDIPTIQKATATLLLDGLNIILSTLIGMLLLAFYHPFLLGFDVVLLFCMTIITYWLGRGAFQTAKQESIIKYKMGHWLQDVALYASVFRVNGGAPFAVQRMNLLTEDYLLSRKAHFQHLLRQMIFAISLQAIASTALLGIGGWLVIESQLTLGQLVASELVVTVIVGAFAKIGKSLESFYDLLASLDKVGHLFEVETSPLSRPVIKERGPLSVKWQDLSWQHPARAQSYSAAHVSISSGQKIALASEDPSKISSLMEMISGLRHPDAGYCEIGGVDAREAVLWSEGNVVHLVAKIEIFHGTILENLTLGRPDVGLDEVRQCLTAVGLLDELQMLSQRLDTPLQSGGHPLTQDQCIRLVLARALLARPNVLLIDQLLDLLSTSQRKPLLDYLWQPDRPWTLIVATHVPEIRQLCQVVEV